MYEKTLKPFPKRLKSLEEKTWMFRGKRLSLFRVFHHKGTQSLTEFFSKSISNENIDSL